MDSEQEITVGAWVELESQLAEVRAKRDQLDAQNLRVADNLRRTMEERDQAVATAAELREEYLKHKEMANANSDQAASLREQLQEMTSQRDAMTRYRDEMRVSRDESRQSSRDLWAELEKLKENYGSASRMIEALQADHDVAKKDLAHAKEAADMFEEENQALRDTAQRLREKLAEMTAQRDRAKALCNEWRIEYDKLQAVNADVQGTIEELRAANKQYQSDWVVAMEELARAREAADMFEAENTALRDTVRTLRATQIHPDLPGLLCAIQGATEQARELI